MSPQDQRIAIAKFCGWTHLEMYKPYVSDWWERAYNPEPEAFLRGIAPNGNGIWNQPPDYLNDLNAIHEAEKMLNLDQRCAYSKLLHRLSNSPYEDLGAIFATASQRAEALLKTLNLWVD